MAENEEKQISQEEEKRTAEVLFGGSLAETLVAAGAVVLAIIGLVGAFPTLLLSIAAIALGSALLFDGAAFSARFANLLRETTHNRIESTELSTGTSAESVGGVIGIALGILSLLGIYPMILIPSAIIVFGATLILGAGANARLNALHIRNGNHHPHHPLLDEVTHEAVTAATGLQLLVGLGAVTLGIIALSGTLALHLSLIAVLAVGGAMLFSGSSLSTRMIGIFKF
jgi:hypothetical protein